MCAQSLTHHESIIIIMNECNDVITCLLIRIVMYGACICLDIAFPKWMTEIIQIAFGYNKWLFT